MTGSGDYSTEMFRNPLDDAAIEAFFTGQPAGEELAPLAGLVEDLRSMASGPAPVPSMQLAKMLAEGFSTANGDLLVTAASNVPGPAPQAAGLPKWRKKMLLSELLAALTTKLAGLGMAAKAGMGLTLAAASTTAAGAAGVLPAPAQHAVATVVSSATPFSFPDTANSAAGVGAKAATDATGTLDATVSDATKTVTDATKTVTDAAKIPAGTGGSGVSVGANTGATGLARANETPAAGKVPPSLPAAAAASGVGSQGSTGLSTANGTPAAGRVPTSVPVASGSAGSQGSTGVGIANGTPAAGRIPANVPGRP